MKDPYTVLLESEKIKKQKTEEKLNGIYNTFMPHVYNVLIKLPFYTGELADDNDLNMIKIQDTFQFFIYVFPFKIRNILSLMEIGSYHDAGILYRSLVESFICYKYYIQKNDGDCLSRYVLRESKRTIKDIFESIVPGYYDEIYSMLCNLTHNNPLTQALFRGNVSRKTPLKTNINNINIDWFSYIYNQLLPLIIGVIEMYKIVYPNNIIEQDIKLIDEKDYIYKYINNDINEKKNLYPTQAKMINYYNEIIRF